MQQDNLHSRLEAMVGPEFHLDYGWRKLQMMLLQAGPRVQQATAQLIGQCLESAEDSEAPPNLEKLRGVFNDGELNINYSQEDNLAKIQRNLARR